MFIKASLYGVLTLLSTTSAFALTCDTGSSSTCAASATAASDCENLGFSKDSPNGCKHYLYCPFDTSYKRCASLDCTSYTLSSCPANGSCSSCKAGGHNYYTLDGCNKGYVKSGNSCVCATTCKDTATVPANATAVKSSCTACGVTTTIITGFNCNTGYVKSGNSCVVRTCPSGYSTAYSSVSSCGPAGSFGWSFSSDGYSGSSICGKCDEIPCPSGSSTTYSSVSSCGSSGGWGWYFSSDGYSGDKRCGKCIAKPCHGYLLTSCPEGATNCDRCWSGDTLKYRVRGCKRGYIASNNTCVANPCTGFPHSSCPEGATSCRSCWSGSSTKYKVNGCKRGYIASNNTCVVNPCTDFTLSFCPEGATSCAGCWSGDTRKYRVRGCKGGYIRDHNSCIKDGCGIYYRLSSCPTNAYCDSCFAYGIKKYKITSCRSGCTNFGTYCYCSGGRHQGGGADTGTTVGGGNGRPGSSLGAQTQI